MEAVLATAALAYLSADYWPTELKKLFAWGRLLEWMAAIGTVGAAWVALWLGMQGLRRSEKVDQARGRFGAADIAAEVCVILLRIREAAVSVESMYGGEDKALEHMRATYRAIKPSA